MFQAEDPEAKASLFRRFLIEASESELQELIDDAPQLFSNQPLALLRELKALVDARLGAEPDTKVFSLSDTHVVRLRCWDRIADRLEAEIKWRSGGSAPNASGRLAESPARPGAEREHAVAARRTIVRQNPGVPHKELCKLLDHESIRLPKRWPEEGFRTWTDAWRTRRRRIHVIFSKDRKPS